MSQITLQPSPTSTDRLINVVHHIDANRMATAQEVLGKLLRDVDTTLDPSAVKYYVFGGALARRLSDTASEEANLYLKSYDVPQIDLFNLLVNHVPFVGLAAATANDLLADACAGRDQVTLIDIGIGTGRQVVEVLSLLANKGLRPKAMRVVGIEPSEWALKMAEQQTLEAADKLGIELTFDASCTMVEAMTVADWDALRRRVDSPVINASFALHHVEDYEGHDVRTEVLQRLRSLNPATLVLSEPNSDHHESDFVKRFHNCWSHFVAVFQVIDQLKIEQRDKDALKVCFFGREIQDILGNPENLRSERHESTASWLKRLQAAGFSLQLPRAEPVAVGPISLEVDREYVSLCHGLEPLVSVMCAVPDDRKISDEVAFAHLPGKSSPTRSPTRLDAETYLAALVSVARADGVVKPEEQDFIQRQARLLQFPAEELWTLPSLDSLLEMNENIDEKTRRAIVRDLIFLSAVDGDYEAVEKTEVMSIAERLGVPDQMVRELEAELHRSLPDPLNAAPSWFQQYWLFSTK